MPRKYIKPFSTVLTTKTLRELKKEAKEKNCSPSERGRQIIESHFFKESLKVIK